MKLSFKGIKSNMNQARYDSMPWLKIYEEQGVPKTLEYPQKTMYQMVVDTATKYPDFIAYEYFGKTCTYQGLMDKIEACAKSLQHIGVKSDDVITLVMPNTPEAIIMFYAVNKIGAVAQMVHPLSSSSEIEFCLKNAQSEYVFTLDFIYDKIAEVKDSAKLKKIILTSASDSMNLLTTIGYWLKAGRKLKLENLSDNVLMWKDFIYEGRVAPVANESNKTDVDLAVILYSGGTTGEPKGIMLTNRNFNSIATQYPKFCPEVKPEDSMLCILPVFHGFGLGVCVHTVLTLGMRAILIPKFTPEDFGNLIKKHRPNFIAGVPTLYEALLQTKLEPDGLSFVKTVISGGDMLSPELQKKVEEYLADHNCGGELRVGWGMTECVAAPIATPKGKLVPGSIGVPLMDTYVKIVKPGTTENAFFDTDGELCVSGPSVMMGYLNNKKETNETLKKHDDGKIWLHTGDMASMDKKGMVFFKSRIKRMIISSGYNIYPTYIENIINSHEKVLTSIVVGEPHEYKGEVAKAYVVLKPEYKASDKIKNEIIEHYQKNLAKYSWPMGIEFRETLPKTKIGKVDYRNVK